MDIFRASTGHVLTEDEIAHAVDQLLRGGRTEDIATPWGMSSGWGWQLAIANGLRYDRHAKQWQRPGDASPVKPQPVSRAVLFGRFLDPIDADTIDREIIEGVALYEAEVARRKAAEQEIEEFNRRELVWSERYEKQRREWEARFDEGNRKAVVFLQELDTLKKLIPELERKAMLYDAMKAQQDRQKVQTSFTRFRNVFGNGNEE